MLAPLPIALGRGTFGANHPATFSAEARPRLGRRSVRTPGGGLLPAGEPGHQSRNRSRAQPRRQPAHSHGVGALDPRGRLDGRGPADGDVRSIRAVKCGVDPVVWASPQTGPGDRAEAEPDDNRSTPRTRQNGFDILAAAALLPVSTWSYRGEENVRHLGPMAQDWHAAFGLGPDDRSIHSTRSSRCGRRTAWCGTCRGRWRACAAVSTPTRRRRGGSPAGPAGLPPVG